VIELTESEQYDLFFELAKNLSHPMREVRVSSVMAISKIANRRCTNILLDKLELEKDTFIKASLIRILGEIGTENLLEELNRYMVHPEPRIRANAIESMVQVKVSDKKQLLDRLCPLIHDENNRVSATALKELIGLGENSYLPYLKLMLKGTDEVRVASALWVVGALKLNQYLEDVVYGLYSDNYQVHSIAHRTLGLFLDEAIPMLFENLSMNDTQVRVYTFLFFARYLKEINDSQKQTMLSFLETEEPYMKVFILQTLYRLKIPEAWGLLSEYMFSADSGLRKVSIEGFKYFTDHEGAFELLLKALKAEQESRFTANLVQYFAGFPGQDSVDALKDFLEHGDQRVRANVIEVLGEIGDEKIIGLLEPHLVASNNRIMANTAVSLFRLGEKKVLNHLKKALSSKDGAMRASAAYALGKTDSSEVLELLVNNLLDDVQSVRRHVMNALLSEDKVVFNRMIDFLKKSPHRQARQVLAELSNRTTSAGNEAGELLNQYVENLSPFEVPDELNEQEINRIMDLLFSSDDRLRIYAIYVTGEKKIMAALPKLICLLFERDDEVVGETILALQKMELRESLVFIRDVYPRLRGENIELAAKVMHALAGMDLDPALFPGRLSPAHKAALQQTG
jgi:HEAT repeat protein